MNWPGSVIVGDIAGLRLEDLVPLHHDLQRVATMLYPDAQDVFITLGSASSQLVV